MATATANEVTARPSRFAIVYAGNLGVALVVCIALLGLGLRLYCLDCYSLWIDEVTSLEAVQRGIAAIFTERFGLLGNQTILYNLLLWLSALPINPAQSAFFVRLLPAIAGALVPLVVYGLGRDLFGRSQGLLAALLAAFSLPLIDRSQDARQYSMIVFLTVCMAYCLLRADRTGRPLWWGLFALSTGANLLYSYTSLLLALPPFAPYLLYLLWRAWQSRNTIGWKTLLSALGSLGIIGVISILSLLDITRIARAPFNLGELSLDYIYSVFVSIFGSFTRVAIDQRLQNALQPLFAVAALIGAYLGIRVGGLARRGVYLAGLTLLLPVLMLVLLSTSSLVFSRYVLFGAPFYLLLIGNGIVTTIQKVDSLHRQSLTRILRVGALALLMSALVASAFSIYIFNTPQGHIEQSLRPDFRGAGAYLSRTVRSQDSIIIADQPMHGWKVMNYYWEGKSPATVYNIADPRLFSHKQEGDVYWVFWLIGGAPGSPDAPWRLLSAKEQAWADVAIFGDVVVMKEAHPISILTSMDRMAARLEKIIPGSYISGTLRGSILQAQGDIEGAVASYKAAIPSPINVSSEDLRSAQGFMSVGMIDEAWYWGVLSKFDQPANAEAHRWLSQRLAEQGYTEESQAELAVAEALAR